jgi:hypothetical protein
MESEVLETIRTRIHEVVGSQQKLITKVALIDLKINNTRNDVTDHEKAIRSLEKFMYTSVGISIGANFAIQLLFKIFGK